MTRWSGRSGRTTCVSSGGGQLPEQLELVRAGARAATKAARARDQALPPLAAQLPVARVCVEVALPHLDRPFDYLVPEALDAPAQPGVRVRVRFAGQLVDGYLLERVGASEHVGTLARLHKVVSPEPVLSDEIHALARAVATRYAGTVSDVLRLAIPPRHARTEAETRSLPPPPEPTVDPAAWAPYEQGPHFLGALAAGRGPRAVWAAMPGADWAPPVAAAMAAAVAAGKGALAVVPDGRDLTRLSAACEHALGAAGVVALTADLGPAERYRRWLRVRRGQVRAVIGTRAAMFAPVADLGLVVIWDDGDDLHSEGRAPYPHVREVLCLRAQHTGAAALIGGYAVTAEGAALVESGWAHPVAPGRALLRTAAPQVVATGTDSDLARDPAARAARIPSAAWKIARDGLAQGPVLIQVPRAGYVPSLGCGHCRSPARCPHCYGPLGAASAQAPPTCTWCGKGGPGWQCPHCQGSSLRVLRAGEARTAEELGRAFPGVSVRSSRDGQVLTQVGPEPALVVATTGAEPWAPAGYSAAVLLDGWSLLARADLRAGEEALRRWVNAAALVRPGGPVVLVAEEGLGPVGALLNWDMHTFAARELAERRASRFPPAARLAELTGPADAVADLLERAVLPAGAEILGPVDLPDPAVRAAERAGKTLAPEEAVVRAVVRAPRESGSALALALQSAAGVRSARKSAGAVRIRVDPMQIG
ncbi:MAG: primosomal protein N' [Sporichthyaceae bacterium]